MNEQEAFERLKLGDRAALDWTFRQTRDACVPYYVSRFKMRKEEALDLFVDALLKMASKLEAEPEAKLTARLSTVINNYAHFVRMEEIRDSERIYKKWKAYQKEASLANDADEPFETDYFEDFLNRIEHKIKEIGDPCETLLHDRYWLGKSFKLIAQEALERLSTIIDDKYEGLLKKKMDALRSQIRFCIGKLT